MNLPPTYSGRMRAWWSYWMSLAIAAILWVGVAVLTTYRDIEAPLANPVILLILVTPLVAAGLNLIVFRESHELVCRMEARRHPWLRALVGDGYSALTFLVTGVTLLAFVGLILGTRIR